MNLNCKASTDECTKNYVYNGSDIICVDNCSVEYVTDQVPETNFTSGSECVKPNDTSKCLVKDDAAKNCINNSTACSTSNYVIQWNEANTQGVCQQECNENYYLNGSLCVKNDNKTTCPIVDDNSKKCLNVTSECSNTD